MPNFDEEQLYLAKIEESDLSDVHNLIVSKTGLDLFYVSADIYKRYKRFFYGSKSVSYGEYIEALNVTHHEPNLLVGSVYQIYIPSLNFSRNVSSMDMLMQLTAAGLDCYNEVTESIRRLNQRTKQL